VTKAGQALYTSDFARGAEGWEAISGNWQVQEGAYRQSSRADNVQAHAGNASWSDYVYTLKARKLGGAEGFLVMFHVLDQQNWVWWNLGGWGNREHALERCENGGKSSIGRHVPGNIETGRWYDIRIELQGNNIKCYLDDKLIHNTNYPQMKPLYASASYEKASGDVIVKAVNVSQHALTTQMHLRGVARLGSSSVAIVLTSDKPTDENSLANPGKVAPVTQMLEAPSPSFGHVFPGNSVTVMRLKTNAVAGPARARSAALPRALPRQGILRSSLCRMRVPGHAECSAEASPVVGEAAGEPAFRQAQRAEFFQ
jgi:alpha-L-arabinofuranosidase